MSEDSVGGTDRCVICGAEFTSGRKVGGGGTAHGSHAIPVFGLVVGWVEYRVSLCQQHFQEYREMGPDTWIDEYDELTTWKIRGGITVQKGADRLDKPEGGRKMEGGSYA